MEKVATKLKELRKSAVPRLTVRAMADALEMPLGSYARYESTYDYKKSFLPIDLTRKIASVLASHGIDAAEVMKLAGLNEDEAEPEGNAIEAAQPQVQYVSMPLALPSEAALRDMFRSLLVLVPEGATKDEAAEILARRLPSGIAACGPLVLDPHAAPSPVGAEASRSPATDHRASAPSSRT
ncbi:MULTISPECIES: XRE family transcriptional regulator [Sphingobium]|uniref:XRE family transcriptional regulator n=1 Tax=Sphingobium TaxID=165695 RepID=UPI0030199920